MKKIKKLILAVSVILLLTSCSANTDSPQNQSAAQTNTSSESVSTNSTQPDNEIDWSAIPTASETDFETLDFDEAAENFEEIPKAYEAVLEKCKDGIIITKYTGDNETVNIPKTINGKRVIGLEGTFNGNQTLKNVNIPENVLVLTWTFTDCIALECVTVPESVNYIEYTFKGCHSLKCVILSNGLKTIGEGAFYECPITNITIPDSVKSIDTIAFGGITPINIVYQGKSYNENELVDLCNAVKEYQKN